MVTKMPTIPLVRTLLGDEEIAAVTRVLKSGQLAAGPEVAAFEAEFAAMCGVRHAIAVNSGTAALHCALDAANVQVDDEVVTTPFTFAATATPILMQRARPKFVDIDEKTFNADLDALAASVTVKTKAVIGVDLFGLPFATDGIEGLRAKGITVVEDACQSIGASRDSISAGATADVGCFSLYATKNLMTGEGGMLTTNSDAIASAAKRFRQHGQGERYEYLSLGYNYRMTDMAAAIGRVQLTRLNDIRSKRIANAQAYNALLDGVDGIRTPFVPAGVVHAYHQYSIVIDETATPNGANRDQVREALLAQGIGCGIYYPTPLHLNPLFANIGYTQGSFPVAERVARRVLALPIHPLLSPDDLERVATAIRSAVGA